MKKWKELDKYIKDNWYSPEEIEKIFSPTNVARKYRENNILESEPAVFSACCVNESSEIPFEEHETFQELLFRLIDERKLNDADVYKKANVDKRLFSKIRSDSEYHPSKNTVIQLAFGLELPIDDALDFIEEAGYTLSYSIKFDVVIRYFLEKGDYNLMEVNSALFDHDLPLLFK